MAVTQETSTTPAAVRAERVTRTFPGNITAVDHLSLDIPTGQFLALLGPSGCGKSTLLRIIAGLDHANHGAVTVTAKGVGYVFQDAHLLPWRNILSNVSLPLELAGLPKPERLARAARALADVGLADFAHRHPAELSGGMRMRVSLARALVTEPALLLMDEPFAALDEITRQSLDEMLRDLWRKRPMTVLFVTHSIAEATFLAQRAVVLTRRPARIVLDHPIDLPPHRTAPLRGQPEFARETRALYEALETGMRA